MNPNQPQADVPDRVMWRPYAIAATVAVFAGASAALIVAALAGEAFDLRQVLTGSVLGAFIGMAVAWAGRSDAIEVLFGDEK